MDAVHKKCFVWVPEVQEFNSTSTLVRTTIQWLCILVSAYAALHHPLIFKHSRPGIHDRVVRCPELACDWP